MEGKIQNSQRTSGYTRDINNHSSAVVDVYDNVAASRRNLFITSMGAGEGASCSDEEFRKFYEEGKSAEKDNVEKMKIDAKKYLEDRKKKGKNVVDFSPNPVTAEDELVLKSIFTSEDVKGKVSFLCITSFKYYCIYNYSRRLVQNLLQKCGQSSIPGRKSSSKDGSQVLSVSEILHFERSQGQGLGRLQRAELVQ